MWITQTYLGEVELGAKCFVYYLYEDYVEQQKDLTSIIQQELERLGGIYGNEVSLLMPNNRYADNIESENRKFPQIWDKVYGLLPGLLILDKPLIKVDKRIDQFYFVSFKEYKELYPKYGFAVTRPNIKAQQKIHQDFSLVREVIEDIIKNNPKKDNQFLKKIIESIELKPGIFGIRIDLIKLFKK